MPLIIRCTFYVPLRKEEVQTIDKIVTGCMIHPGSRNVKTQGVENVSE